MSSQQHKWSIEDDIVALYLYRFGDKGLPLPASEIGKKLGMGRGSLLMRVENFRSLDGGEGLSKWSKQSEMVYQEHKETPQDELEVLVLRVIM